MKYIAFVVYAAMIVLMSITSVGCSDSKQNDYLPKISEIQKKYDYTYYEAYTFAYRYALVKASIAKDKYWIRFYGQSWGKYAHDKGHSKKLLEVRFFQIMDHADKEARLDTQQK